MHRSGSIDRCGQVGRPTAMGSEETRQACLLVNDSWFDVPVTSSTAVALKSSVASFPEALGEGRCSLAGPQDAAVTVFERLYQTMAVLERSITRRFDYTVDVPLLMSHPKSALLGVLQLLDGWQNVSMHHIRWCAL